MSIIRRWISILNLNKPWFDDQCRRFFIFYFLISLVIGRVSMGTCYVHLWVIQTANSIIEWAGGYDCADWLQCSLWVRQPPGNSVYKLCFVGIICFALSITAKFISNRSPHVIVDCCRSKLDNVRSGVPQFRNIGPLLFLLSTTGLLNQWWTFQKSIEKNFYLLTQCLCVTILMTRPVFESVELASFKSTAYAFFICQCWSLSFSSSSVFLSLLSLHWLVFWAVIFGLNGSLSLSLDLPLPTFLTNYEAGLPSVARLTVEENHRHLWENKKNDPKSLAILLPWFSYIYFHEGECISSQ